MSTRRLAVIMFADIVGYTAMMQRDEANSMVKVSRFRGIMAQQVKKHLGELLEIRGDGSLNVFATKNLELLFGVYEKCLISKTYHLSPTPNLNPITSQLGF